MTPPPKHTHVGAVTSFHRDGAGSAAAFRRGLPAPLAPGPALGRHPRSARHGPLRTGARSRQPPGGPGPPSRRRLRCVRLTRCDDQNRNSAPPDVNLPLSFVATPPHAPPSSSLLGKMAERDAGSNARQVTRADRPQRPRRGAWRLREARARFSSGAPRPGQGLSGKWVCLESRLLPAAAFAYSRWRARRLQSNHLQAGGLQN